MSVNLATAEPDVVEAPGITIILSSSTNSQPGTSGFFRSKIIFKEIASSRPKLSTRITTSYGASTMGILGSVLLEPGKNLNTGSDGRSSIS